MLTSFADSFSGSHFFFFTSSIFFPFCVFRFPPFFYLNDGSADVIAPRSFGQTVPIFSYHCCIFVLHFLPDLPCDASSSLFRTFPFIFLLLTFYLKVCLLHFLRFFILFFSSFFPLVKEQQNAPHFPLLQLVIIHNVWYLRRLQSGRCPNFQAKGFAIFQENQTQRSRLVR